MRAPNSPPSFVVIFLLLFCRVTVPVQKTTLSFSDPTQFPTAFTFTAAVRLLVEEGSQFLRSFTGSLHNTLASAASQPVCLTISGWLANTVLGHKHTCVVTLAVCQDTNTRTYDTSNKHGVTQTQTQCEDTNTQTMFCQSSILYSNCCLTNNQSL